MTATTLGSEQARAAAGGPPPGLLLGGGIVALAALIAVAGPLLAPHDPLGQDLALRFRSPEAAHLLGTDGLGRDILSRLIEGTRLSLLVAVLSTVIAVGLGAGLGLIGAGFGGPVGAVVFGAVDIVRALPSMLLALCLMVALGIGMGSLIFAIGLSFAPHFARITRTVYLREAGAGYVAAATVLGAGRLRLLLRHVLPNVTGALLTQIAIVIPRAITTESVLSFFGLGADPATPTWGRMIADAVPFVERAPHAVGFPIAALALTTLGFALLGDHIRRRFDPLRHVRQLG